MTSVTHTLHGKLEPDYHHNMPVNTDDPRTQHLQPFTKGDPRAKEAGRKGGQTRARNAKAKRDTGLATAQQAATTLNTLHTHFDRATLGQDAANIAQYILGRIGTGDIPIRNGDEAAALLRALVDIARLEEGQATSHTITAHLSTTEAIARVQELQARARLPLSATAQAAADPMLEGGRVDTPPAPIEARIVEPTDIEHEHPPAISDPPPPGMGPA